MTGKHVLLQFTTKVTKVYTACSLTSPREAVYLFHFGKSAKSCLFSNDLSSGEYIKRSDESKSSLRTSMLKLTSQSICTFPSQVREREEEAILLVCLQSKSAFRAPLSWRPWTLLPHLQYHQSV